MDTFTGHFEFVCAGHPGPILVSRDGSAEIFDASAIPIGMMEGTQYTTAALDLEPGDRLYLYSDGFTEETNAADEQFGRERLGATLQSGLRVTLERSTEALVRDVTSWRGRDGLSDDITVLGVELCEE